MLDTSSMGRRRWHREDGGEVGFISGKLGDSWNELAEPAAEGRVDERKGRWNRFREGRRFMAATLRTRQLRAELNPSAERGEENGMYGIS